MSHVRKSVDDISWYVRGALMFLEAVAQDITAHGTPPKNGRAKHLVALPLVGTGKGGAFHSAGGVVVALIPELYNAANHLEYGTPPPASLHLQASSAVSYL